MSDEQQNILLIRGAIASLPEEQQARIKEIASQLRAIVEIDKEVGFLALALIGAEMAVPS